MTAIYAPVLSETAITELPAWVYTDLADPDVSQIDVPFGRYSIPAQVDIIRSSFTIDWHGSTLVFDGSLVGYHFWIASTVDPYETGTARDYTHLTGQIYEATTSLTMHIDEVVDVAPGEWVQIRAGVNYSDPNEPARYIIRQIESVVGQVITFTQALGTDIVVYADEDALKAVSAPSQWTKIGTWGSVTAAGTIGNGLGLDHGMIRYVGGMLHDITFKNFHIEQSIPADSGLTAAYGKAFFTRDIVNFTLQNLSACNTIHSLLHCWRSDNVLLDGLRWTGEARCKISGSATFVGWLINIWGGTGLTFQNIEVTGRNMVLVNAEVSPGDVLFKNVNYTMDFRKNYIYVSAAVMFGFYGTIWNTSATIEDSTFSITTDVFSTWHMDGSNNQSFKNCTFDDPADFSNYFHFQLYTIEGTITFGNIAYGPFTTRTDTVVRTKTVNGNHIYPPKGLYKRFQFRVLDAGSCSVIGDGHGNTYNAALSSGDWTAVNSGSWLQMVPYTPLATYLALNSFHFNWGAGSTSLTIEFDIDYYPAPDDVGWTMD